MRLPLEPIRGMRDLTPPESDGLEYVGDAFADIASRYGYELIILPTIELFDLFAIKSGPEIKRSMYVFTDKGGRQVCLRPEFTAGVARAYLRLMRDRPKPVKLFYVGPAFRYEEPQAGRYREFFQAGVEFLGDPSIYADVELLLLIRDYYRAVGLNDYRVKISTMAVYRNLFREWGMPEETQDLVIHYIDKKQLDDALKLVRHYNPSGISVIEELLSVNSPEPDEIRSRVSSLELRPESIEEIDRLLKILELARNLNVGNPYVDLGFARGLAYYTGFIFEVVVPDVGFSIGGGGRYDKLVSMYGGEDLPATGFALGLDRLLLVLTGKGWNPPKRHARSALIALAGDVVFIDSVASRLRGLGLSVDVRVTSRKKLDNVLSDIAGRGYKYAVFLGEREVKERAVTVKNLERRTQKTLSLERLGLEDLP
ncbi:MAG: histidine--tRNA ligase [Zestosphaera sp.]